jgi:hypothetical protein
MKAPKSVMIRYPNTSGIAGLALLGACFSAIAFGDFNVRRIGWIGVVTLCLIVTVVSLHAIYELIHLRR